MNRFPLDIWDRLEHERPSGPQLAARPGLPELTNRLFCAVDSQGQHHLLVSLSDEDSDLHDSESRGLSVATRELLVRGHDTTRYLDVECRDPAGFHVLDLIGHDLARELGQGKRQPADIVRRLLAKWR